jgi:hypothetical protein
MPTRSTDDRYASRAEARRRARLAARGEVPDEPDEEHRAAESTEPRGGFLRRIFPPAPPLPNRPDPLAGFDPDGPMRPVRERLFLLRSNLKAWVLPGIVAFIGLYASFFYATSFVGMLATFVQFGALIAAGWFGWQRPTLFGATAGALSGILTGALILLDFARIGAETETLGGTGAVLTQTLLTAIYQAAFGFLGGWYGGYLRRRQTHLNEKMRRSR